MKILLTGGHGFAASRIYSYYKDHHQICVLHHQPFDLSDQQKLYHLFSQIKPDIVLHTAAISSPSVCESNPDYSYMVNVVYSEHIARACQEYHAKMIFFSSDQVYAGSLLQIPHNEQEPLSPHRTYSIQKLKAEASCAAIHPDTVSLRLSWMYDTKKLSPQEHGTLITDLLENISASRPVSYPIYDHRSITSVWEVIKHLEKAFSLPGGIYNFGSPNDQNTYEVVSWIFDYLHLDTTLLKPNKEAFADAPRNLRMDMKKTDSHGITFHHTIDGLIHSLSHFKKIPQT